MHDSLNFRCHSLNVKGLNKSIKRRSIFRRIHNQNHHFSFLQETHSSKDSAITWEAEWGGNALFSHGSTNSKGVMILINPKLDCKIKKVIADKDGRYIIADILLNQIRIVLVNIYAPNDQTQQVHFFKKLQQHLKPFVDEQIVVGGDFNCALTEKDKKGGNPVSKKALVINEINQLCNAYNLTDVWRSLNPDLESFTWRNKSFKIQCRLDYFLVSQDLCRLATSCKIIHAAETDHSEILIHFKNENANQRKGPGFWKFNNSLLRDEKYINKLRNNLDRYKDKYKDVEDRGLQWDLLKMEIRGFTVMYSKSKAKGRQKEETELQNKANELRLKAERNPADKKILNELFATNLRLEKLLQYKTKGAILRSKVRWFEHGERNTKYFLSIEKRNSCQKAVTKLKLKDDTYTYDQFEILQEEKQFYESLYTSKDVDAEKFSHSPFFKQNNITPLSHEDRLACENLISTNECLKALKEFTNNKTPGTDGFTSEFYKFFWPELCTEMIASFNYAFHSGILSISQRRGIISLIPKKNKDTSLLNVDYKILTKVIAKRLEKLLPKIINPDQTGYVKGRYIGENVRLIQDIMFYTKHMNSPGIAIFLDFRKAFDSIEWEYLKAALKAFNFGPNLLNWIDVLYNDASSCVINNGHASSFFRLQRGVRQGCPLSGLLFIIGIELFARALKNDQSIKGINVETKEIKITQYADDTTVFLRDEESVEKVLRLLDEFKSISGLEINTSKTEAMWLGRWRDKTHTPFNFKWPKEPICALGIYFSYNTEDANKLNFEEKMKNLEKTLKGWKRRKLTLLGRINIVKTLGLSKLIYSASVLPIPKHLVKEINRIAFNFIWDGKPAKVKRSTIIREKKRGGLKMLDFEIMDKALKVAWTERLKTPSSASWKIIPELGVKQYGGLTFLINCQYDIKMLSLDNLPSFYHTLLTYLQDLNSITTADVDNVPDKIIWNNQNIVINGKSIFYSSWFKRGIINIRSMMTENNQFLSLPELEQKFNLKIPFTLYYGLVAAIPKEWKSSLRDALSRDNDSVEEATCSIKPLTTRTTYSAFLSKMATSPTCENKIFKYGYTKENIQNVYLLPFTTTKDTKLITFQYKVIHNILPNRVSLFRAGIVNDDICPLCNAEKQTNNHMLYSCPETTTFWDQFTDWWYQKFKQNLILNESIILYGWHQKSLNKRVLNYALLLAKYHIFCSSVRDNKLDFDSFLSRLRTKLNILREVSLENKTFNNFQST